MNIEHLSTRVIRVVCLKTYHHYEKRMQMHVYWLLVGPFTVLYDVWDLKFWKITAQIWYMVHGYLIFDTIWCLHEIRGNSLNYKLCMLYVLLYHTFNQYL